MSRLDREKVPSASAEPVGTRCRHGGDENSLELADSTFGGGEGGDEARIAARLATGLVANGSAGEEWVVSFWLCVPCLSIEK